MTYDGKLCVGNSKAVRPYIAMPFDAIVIPGKLRNGVTVEYEDGRKRRGNKYKSIKPAVFLTSADGTREIVIMHVQQIDYKATIPKKYIVFDNELSSDNDEADEEVLHALGFDSVTEAFEAARCMLDA